MTASARKPTALTSRSRTRQTVRPDVDSVVNAALLKHFVPSAVVVRRNGRVVHVHGAVDRFIKLPHSKTTANLFQVVFPSIKPSLRALFDQAVSQHRKRSQETVGVKRKGTEGLRVTVKPLGSRGRDDLWLVVFEEISSQKSASRPPDRPQLGQPSRFERELRRTRSERQLLVSELEGSNEESRAANEQIPETDAALQSASEEPTPSPEELQSMNERLVTLNERLQEKVVEAARINDDLTHLIASTEIATILVDARLCIKRFTGPAESVVNLRASDIGLPIDRLATNLVGVDLAREAQAVLDSGTPLEKGAATRDGRSYLLRVLPYRTRDQSVYGAVLTLTRVTSLTHAERELGAARDETAAALNRMTRMHEVATSLHSSAAAMPAQLDAVLGAALEITGASKGTIQLLDHRGVLTIAAQIGFEPRFLEFFAKVGLHTHSACGVAFLTREPVCVEDVTKSAVFAGSPSLDVLLAADVRACHSSPLLDRSGRPIGMLSTHYGQPRQFTDTDRRWLDLVARVVVDVVERHRAASADADVHAELERRVAERTNWLELMHEVSLCIDSASTWDDALYRVLQCVCQGENWQAGHVFLPTPDAPDMMAPVIRYVQNERYRAFIDATERWRYQRGELLPGRVYAEGTPAWVNDQTELLATAPRRAEAIARLGLVSAAILPITVGSDVVAVLELVSNCPHAPNEQLVNLMNDVGAHIGRVLERERAALRMADLVWREQQDLLHTLHDSLGQTLTAFGMLSAGLRAKLAGAGDAEDTAHQLAKQASLALQQVRQLSKGFFPIEIDAAGFLPALQELASTTQSFHKLAVRVSADEATSIRDGQVATQLYRIAQEAVNNAVKHAQAQTITIDVRAESGLRILQVADDGIGLSETIGQESLGLQIMRFRATSIGGSFSIESAPGKGTRVTCAVREWPLAERMRRPAGTGRTSSVAKEKHGR